MGVVALQSIIQVLGAAVFYSWQDEPECGWVALGLVGRHSFRRHRRLGHGALEEGPGRRGVARLREEDVHHLADLVDRSVDVGVPPPETAVRLVDALLLPHRLAVLAGGFPEQGTEHAPSGRWCSSPP